MKMKPCEMQVGRGTRSRRAGGMRQWTKRQAKADPENAPRQRRYYGYD